MAPFLARASSWARCRCSAMSSRNAFSSTATPASPAISRVRSIGKPKVSCRAKASAPLSARFSPLATSTACSRRVVPDSMVLRNARSSA